MKTVYIPVEVKQRAFTAKLLLACNLVREGFDVVIGDHGPVREMALNDRYGVYIEKDFFYLRSESMKKMKENGFLLYAYDEEGLVYLQDQLYIDERTHEDMISICDKAFTWGGAQDELLKRAYPWLADRFMQVGNPRLDLITNNYMERIYRREIAEIKQLGRFLLVNSNFTTIDSPEEDAKLVTKIVVQHGKEDRFSQYTELLLNYFLNDRRIFESLTEAIAFLAEKTDLKIVIRTHPAEDNKKWGKLSRMKNVIVSSEFDVNPWLYCCEAVIHHGCTTGIEGYLVGKPIIAYSPYEAREKELGVQNLPNAFSEIVSNKEELLEKVISRVVKKEPREDKSSIVDAYLLLDHMRGVAVNRITEQIKRDCAKNTADSAIRYHDSVRCALMDCAYIIKKIMPDKGGIKKFAYESKSILRNRLMQMLDISECGNITISHVEKNVFCLSKKSLRKRGMHCNA